MLPIVTNGNQWLLETDWIHWYLPIVLPMAPAHPTLDIMVRPYTPAGPLQSVVMTAQQSLLPHYWGPDPNPSGSSNKSRLFAVLAQQRWSERSLPAEPSTSAARENKNTYSIFNLLIVALKADCLYKDLHAVALFRLRLHCCWPHFLEEKHVLDKIIIQINVMQFSARKNSNLVN